MTEESDVNQTPEEQTEFAAEELIQADIVEIYQGGANHIQAREVMLRQASANQVQADTVLVRQGGMATVTTTNLETNSSAMGYVQAQDASLCTSSVVAIVTGRDAELDQSAAQVMVVGGKVDMDQSVAALMIANEVSMDSSNVVFLLAGKVEGDVRPVFGPKETILFGLISGFAAGAMVLTGILFGRKRKKKK